MGDAADDCFDAMMRDLDERTAIVWDDLGPKLRRLPPPRPYVPQPREFAQALKKVASRG